MKKALKFLQSWNSVNDFYKEKIINWAIQEYENYRDDFTDYYTGDVLLTQFGEYIFNFCPIYPFVETNSRLVDLDFAHDIAYGVLIEGMGLE